MQNQNIDSTMQKDIPQYSIIRRFKASKTLNNIINTKLCILFFFFSFFSLLSILKLVRFFFSLFLIGKKKKPSLLSGSLLLKLFFFFLNLKKRLLISWVLIMAQMEIWIAIDNLLGCSLRPKTQTNCLCNHNFEIDWALVQISTNCWLLPVGL